MIVAEYATLFHKLARHVTFILDTEYERVCFFFRRLIFLLCLCTKSLVAVDRSFPKVLDHAKIMKKSIMKPIGATIRGLDIRSILVRAIVVPHSKVSIFMIEILRVHSMNLKVSLVNLFR